MPDDVAIEKVQVLEKLGATVERVRPGECPVPMQTAVPSVIVAD